eukprot:Seg15267.2 transcript_id=Seg15267.2/GoldUCD/mRNA.D3Y31 product="hypothetical protein" protein_id=Seg15267.2/GoldUCD/D3Y31
MKNPFTLLSLICFSLITLTSCSDSLEQVTEDSIAHTDKLADLLNSTAKGEISTSEAAKQIREWDVDSMRINGRAARLTKDMSDLDIITEMTKVQKKYSKERAKATSNLRRAVQILKTSGNVTEEIDEIMKSIN